MHDYIDLRPDMLEMLLSYREKTGWGYVAIVKRGRDMGLEMPLGTSVQSQWVTGQQKTIRSVHWENLLKVYDSLPEELWGDDSGVKRKGMAYLPANNEIHEQVELLMNNPMSIARILQFFNAPASLTPTKLSNLHTGRTKSISAKHAQWLKSTARALSKI